MQNYLLRFSNLGLQDYLPLWQKMKDFTENRDIDTPDEIWFLEHPPVFTQGQAGKSEHILNAGSIPIVQVDRGGQVTYHGPGQLIVYFMINIKRRQLGVRPLVNLIENTVITLLADYGIDANAKSDAPGVYVNGAKIASLGLRIRRGCSYHGLSFNIDMDLEPFSRINPCGFQNLAITQLKDWIPSASIPTIIPQLEKHLTQNLQSV